MSSRPPSSKISAPADAGIARQDEGTVPPPPVVLTPLPAARTARSGASTARKATRSSSTMSASTAVPDEVLVLAGVLGQVEEEVRVHGVAPDPERQAVARLEGLADHRDVASPA